MMVWIRWVGPRERARRKDWTRDAERNTQACGAPSEECRAYASASNLVVKAP
jgi:hypothetical protein